MSQVRIHGAPPGGGRGPLVDALDLTDLSICQVHAVSNSLTFVQQKKMRNVPGWPLLGTYLRKVNMLVWEDVRTIIYSCQDIQAA